jgi:hypothetical protein
VGKRSPKAEEQSLGKYVYCVIRSPPEKKSFGDLGFDGGEVYTLDYKDFAPVVSDAKVREYAVDEADVYVHRHVVDEVMKEHDVLPVAYGMIFKNRKLLMIAMGAGYTAMAKAADVVSGKVELGIKVFLPKEVKNWNGKREDCKNDYLESLQGLAMDSKELKLFSERLVVNAAFLVDRSKIDDFSVKVGELSSRYAEAKTQYSGPWPAYNFVDIYILGKHRKGFR